MGLWRPIRPTTMDYENKGGKDEEDDDNNDDNIDDNNDGD